MATENSVRSQRQPSKKARLAHALPAPLQFVASLNSATCKPLTPACRRSRLLDLPAELREQIWTHAVTAWTSTDHVAEDHASGDHQVHMLRKMPVRMDRFNRSLPPGITRACRMTRHETLHLYYESNIFECWRPIYWNHDWTFSILVDFLTGLGPRARWLNDLVLLYKHESELEHDIEAELRTLGLDLKEGIITNKKALSEFELTHEALGLPRHFGKRGRDRWWIGSGGIG